MFASSIDRRSTGQKKKKPNSVRRCMPSFRSDRGRDTRDSTAGSASPQKSTKSAAYHSMQAIPKLLKHTAHHFQVGKSVSDCLQQHIVTPEKPLIHTILGHLQFWQVHTWDGSRQKEHHPMCQPYLTARLSVGDFTRKEHPTLTRRASFSQMRKVWWGFFIQRDNFLHFYQSWITYFMCASVD